MLSIELADDGQALLHFFQSHQIAGIDVAGGHHRNLEIDGRGALAVPVVGEAEVGFVLADVAADAAGAGHRAGKAPGNGFLAADDADALGAIDENAVLVEQLLDVLGRGGMSSSMNFFTIRLKTASSGKSMFSPPTRVQLVWKRWPDMYSTMS